MEDEQAVPPERFCRRCGGLLEVENLTRKRVSVFGPRQWSADFHCPDCGDRSGSSWATMVAVPAHDSRSLLHRLVRRLPRRRSREHGGWVAAQNAFLREGGGVDLARLVAEAPWRVCGLAGRPLGLRLRSAGWSSGSAAPLTGVDLGYSIGSWEHPSAAFTLDQRSQGVGTPGREPDAEDLLYAVQSIVANYSSAEEMRASFERRDFHRQWNLRRMEQAVLSESTVALGDRVLPLRLRSWPGEDVLVGELEVDGRRIVVTSLGLDAGDVAAALGTLTDLKQDAATLAEHQADIDAALEALRRRDHG